MNTPQTNMNYGYCQVCKGSVNIYATQCTHCASTLLLQQDTTMARTDRILNKLASMPLWKQALCMVALIFVLAIVGDILVLLLVNVSTMTV